MFDKRTEEGYAPFDLYSYNPSQAPAYAFCAMFGILAICHLIAMVPYRSFFPLPLIIGSGMEATAYYFRSRSHSNLRQTLPFLIQNLLLLAAPPFLAASIYMSPRRIARILNKEDLVISPRLITKLFVVVDIACFTTQVAGAIMSGDEDQSTAHTGQTLIITGLVLQILAFAAFVAWTESLHARLQAQSIEILSRSGITWDRYIYGLYAISCLFIIRNITRIIEYKQGSDGPLLSKEVYLYVLDGAVMLTIVSCFLILHPGRLRYKARRVAIKVHSGDNMDLEHFGPQHNHP